MDSSNPAQSTNTGFDHTSYPHILSRILTYSPISVLRTFRETSKYFLNSKEITRLIDSDLYRHLILVDIDLRWWIPSSEEGQHLLTRAPLLITQAPLGLPLDNSDATRYTKFLDISVKNYSKDRYPLFPSLDVIRVFLSGTTDPTLPSCNTVIVYSNMRPGAVRINPSQVRRVVFPLAGYRSNLRVAMEKVRWEAGGSIEEVVILGKRVVDRRAAHILLYEFVKFCEGCMDGEEVVFQRAVFVGIGEEVAKLAIEKWCGDKHESDDMSARLSSIVKICYFYTWDEYAETLGGESEWLADEDWSSFR